MRLVELLCLCLVGSLLVSGCAGMSATSKGSLRTDIGTSTREAILRVTSNLLQGQYGYRLEREATGSQNIRYVTYWNEHSPLKDERARGYESIRSRVSVLASPKNRSAKTYRVSFRADYAVKKSTSADWVPAEITQMRRERIEDIIQDLRDELTSGIREY